MRRIELPLGQKTIISETFEGLNDLVTTLESRTENSWVGPSGSRKEPRMSFKKITYEAAKEAARFGLNSTKVMDSFNKSIETLDKNKINASKKSISYHHVVGGKPIVANALMGLPKSMIARKTVVKKQRVVNILMETSFSAGTDSDEIVQWGSEVIKHVVNLERQGWRVRLQALSTFSEEHKNVNKIHSMRVVLKEENQPLDLKRLTFVLGHVGFFRSLGFDWYETLPGAESISGYGKPVYNWDKDYVTKYLKAINGDNYYYIKLKDNLNEVFSNVK
jgi:hypothetical protein